ncbi:MAG: UDP-N-acetylglucosamine--N-acetylmuramyl-(pentapeptide) pyrophosphoryl-undecaprenol N-acetylglucosamine transferase [Elusimicrobiaceae bacterium]|nr:UDP-N-acetylglucosamine--N-acetylmuramyl-(pentapeptide) pyrophosphoryl-undecaprenol N-acetylglucosamine transferase [Elusimicrobiaceae bacterium]
MIDVYLIAAGGTGGHFYPGIALGKALMEKGNNVIFIIKQGSPNIKYMDDNELSFQEIDFVSMPRNKNIKTWFNFFIKFIKSLKQMRQLIKLTAPKCCIGMGGYISFPLVFMAHFMGYKTAIHDSNSRIGLANRICAKFSDLVFLGLPVDKVSKKAILVGTPIRKEFNRKLTEEEKIYWEMETNFGINFLIFGGSQGAKKLNYAAAETFKKLLPQSNGRLNVFHVTGTRDFEEIKKIYGDTHNLTLLPYAEDIYSLMKAAHVIIARSGASSLAEICALKKPSILVPFPYAADNHQYFNAKLFQDAGISFLIEESENLEQDLYNTVKRLLSEPEHLQKMRASYNNLTLPDPLQAAEKMIAKLEGK